MKRFSWLLIVLLVAGCGGGGESETANTSGEAAKEAAPTTGSDAGMAAPVAVAAATRNVACGCSIESVGACGNYVEIDGKFVEIANWEAIGLGAMEWCGQEGVHAQTAGEVRDGKFYATTVAVHSH